VTSDVDLTDGFLLTLRISAALVEQMIDNELGSTSSLSDMVQVPLG
jgi:hypothetical protein